jgi:hypothetical protein
LRLTILGRVNFDQRDDQKRWIQWTTLGIFVGDLRRASFYLLRAIGQPVVEEFEGEKGLPGCGCGLKGQPHSKADRPLNVWLRVWIWLSRVGSRVRLGTTYCGLGQECGLIYWGLGDIDGKLSGLISSGWMNCPCQHRQTNPHGRYMWCTGLRV